MRTLRTLTAAALVALATGACVNPSLTEMRAKEPVTTWASPVAPVVVLDCVQAQLEAERGLPQYNPKSQLRLERESQAGGTVALLARGPVHNGIEFIVTARPEGTGSRVELRTWMDWPRVIGPVVAGCAKGVRA